MFRALCAHHQEVRLYYTAPGIITPVGDRLVRRLGEEWMAAYLVINKLDAPTQGSGNQSTRQSLR